MGAMRRALLNLVLSVPLSVGMAAVGTAGSITDVGQDAVGSLRAEGATIVDVRRADEWQATGVIPGSILITAFDRDGRFNPDFLAQFEAQIPRSTPVVVVCRSGNRSAKVAQLLAGREGYTTIYNLTGGMIDWIGKGNPVEACSRC